MTIRAFLEHQWLLKVGFCVALHAGYFAMFAEQREFRPGMVEGTIYFRWRGFVPAGRVMTRLTGLWEAAAMRISVAVSAIAKRNSNIEWPRVERGIVAEFTPDLNV